MEEERVQKVLSELGYCSRREAEKLIEEGRVKVNGAIVSLGFKCIVDDVILVDDRPVRKKAGSKHYLMLNKPVGYVSTLSDPEGRPTVTELIPPKYGRVFPIGRLDLNSSGLLILTDDGEFSNLVMHPSSSPEKEYVVKVRHVLRGDEIGRIEKGVYIKSEGYKTAPGKAELLEEEEDSATLSIIIEEGKKREIRRMMMSLGHPVIDLKRIRIGNILLGDLQSGSIKEIPIDQIETLKNNCLKKKAQPRKS